MTARTIAKLPNGGHEVALTRSSSKKGKGEKARLVDSVAFKSRARSVHIISQSPRVCLCSIASLYQIFFFFLLLKIFFGFIKKKGEEESGGDFVFNIKKDIGGWQKQFLSLIDTVKSVVC